MSPWGDARRASPDPPPSPDAKDVEADSSNMLHERLMALHGWSVTFQTIAYLINF
jgi:hypothetical protein